MDGISRSHGWDKEILQGFLPMGQLVLSEKWVRNNCLPGQSSWVEFHKTYRAKKQIENSNRQ